MKISIELKFNFYLHPIYLLFQALGIICMALASPSHASATSFFLFAVVISFIFTILVLAAYFLGIREALNVAVNWIFSVSRSIEWMKCVIDNCELFR